MKTTRVIAVTVLLIGIAFALHVGQAQQVGSRRTDLQRQRGGTLFFERELGL